MVTYKFVNLKYLPPSSFIDICIFRQVILLRFSNFYEDTNDLICTYIHMYVRTYGRMYVCMYVCLYVCVCMYVSTYVCMYVCIYVFIY